MGKLSNREAWDALYPFASHSFPIGGWRYHYVDEGAGRPLLFVHGNPTWSFYWRNLILAFREQYRTVAVDHLGCGGSEVPPADRYPYTLARRIDDLVEFVERLDLRQITLLAHDWGGAIGLGAVQRLRERFSSIVLFNTGAFPPPFVPLRIRICRTPIIGRLAVQGLNLFARAALWMATSWPRRLAGGTAAGLLAPYSDWNDRLAIDRFMRDIPFTSKHPTWATLAGIEEGLPALGNLPIQLIWGMKDWCFTPACLARFRAAWPSAEVHELEDCNHYVVEDAAERVVPLVQEFLAEKVDHARSAVS